MGITPEQGADVASVREFIKRCGTAGASFVIRRYVDLVKMMRDRKLALSDWQFLAEVEREVLRIADELEEALGAEGASNKLWLAETREHLNSAFGCTPPLVTSCRRTAIVRAPDEEAARTLEPAAFRVTELETDGEPRVIWFDEDEPDSFPDP